MKEQQCRILIRPAGPELTAVEGDNLYTLLLVNGLVRPDDAEGEFFRLDKGMVSPALSEAAESDVFSRPQLSEGWMLASQRRVLGDAEITLYNAVPGLRSDSSLPLGSSYGMAFDLGNGTAAAGLVDLDSHLIPMMTACPNSHFGYIVDADERLRAAESDESLRETLSELLRGDMDQLTKKLVRRAGIKCEAITAITVAGSYFMICLLRGILPHRAQGYAYRRAELCTAAELGLKLFRPEVKVYLLPAVNAEVGGDMTAAALAAGLPLHRDSERLTMLVDLAMEGQLMLAGRGHILACSIPSLPFEGAGIRWGMPAVTGAINAVHIDELVTLNTVRDGRPRGLCGAGLISAALSLVQHGLLDREGHLNAPDKLPPAVARRFHISPGGREFVLSRRDKRFSEDISISQDDVFQLQLAKGSLYAACRAMLSALNATEDDVENIMLAESYRANLDPHAVLSLGLVPRIEEARVSSIGNAAWQGAYLALMAGSNLQELERLSCTIEPFDLTTSAVYADEFIAAMDF